MNPEVRDVFLKRTKMIQSMRRTFDSHGFIEVETPMMQPIAGGAVARPFVTHHNTLDMDLYLRIAPELYLKRLVVGGFDRVYEINRNFRNEGLGWRWNPEFTMLEAYQAYTDYQGIMNLTQESITEAAKAVNGSPKSKWGEQEIDWSNWQRFTMREAIIKFWPEKAGAKPEMGDFASSRGREATCRALQCRPCPHGIRCGCADGQKYCGSVRSRGRGASHAADDHLRIPDGGLAAVEAEADEPDWTERFEIYAGQMEISNGFSELNDPEDQRQPLRGAVKRTRARRRRSPPDG